MCDFAKDSRKYFFFCINKAPYRDRNRQNKKGFDNGSFHLKISSVYFSFLNRQSGYLSINGGV